MNDKRPEPQDSGGGPGAVLTSAVQQDVPGVVEQHPTVVQSASFDWADAAFAALGTPQSPQELFPIEFEVPESRHYFDGEFLTRYVPVYEDAPGRTAVEVAKKLNGLLGKQIGWRALRVSIGPTCNCVGNRHLGVYRGEFGADTVSITYHSDGCGRPLARPDETPEQARERWLSIQQSPDDAYLNGYYPTIPGNDIAHHDFRYSDVGGVKNEDGEFIRNKAPKGGVYANQGGDVLYSAHPDAVTGKFEPIRGGTEIRGGRSEYREKTAGMVQWGAGTTRELERISAIEKDKKTQKLRDGVEAYVKKQMPRKIGEL